MIFISFFVLSHRFDYTMPTLKPVYAYIPLVSPLKKDENMDGFNMGEDNQMKSIVIKNGKLCIEVRIDARCFVYDILLSRVYIYAILIFVFTAAISPFSNIDTDQCFLKTRSFFG